MEEYLSLTEENISEYSEYGKIIKTYLDNYFRKDFFPNTIIIEPGRSLSGMCGVTIGRVINTKRINRKYVVTVSTGKYSAGMDGIGFNMNFYISRNGVFYPPGSNVKYVKACVYGKACSSMDVIEKNVKIPINLKSGDLIVFSGTGAYAAHTATPHWCGRKSPTQIIFDSRNTGN